MKIEEFDLDKLYEDTMVSLVISFPQLAQFCARLGVKIVNDESINALAYTDGKKIYLNECEFKSLIQKDFIETPNGKIFINIGKKELEFVLCHELFHIIGLTFPRGEEKGIPTKAYSGLDRVKNELWNIATDYEINALLYHNEPKIGKKPDFALYEYKYKDMTAEEIYDILWEQYQSNPESVCQMAVVGSSGESNGKDPAIPIKNGIDFGLDKHMPFADDQTKNEIINQMSEIFGSTLNGKGDNAINRLLNRAFKQEPFDWRKALTKYIRGWIKANYTWNKPSRSGMSTGLILPSSSTTPCMHIAVAVDTSGSISNVELETMINHVFSILNQFREFTVDVWCCGSVVYEETFMTFTSKNKQKLKDFTFKSDGGNDMRENFKFLRTRYKGKKPDVFVCLSDFYDPLNGDTETTSPCPCIFMVIDHKDFVPPARIKAEIYEYTVENGKG